MPPRASPQRRTPSTSQSLKDPDSVSIPTRSWQAVIRRVDQLWKPQFAPHHSILGQNGSGKTHLIVHGILPLCTDDKVCIIDNKGDDPVLAASGARPVRVLPRELKRATFDDGKPKSAWYRLVVSDEYAHAQDQVGQALQQIYKEGNWIVVLDETRAISDGQRKPACK
jgi:hypothetical protein